MDDHPNGCSACLQMTQKNFHDMVSGIEDWMTEEGSGWPTRVKYPSTDAEKQDKLARMFAYLQRHLNTLPAELQERLDKVSQGKHVLR